MLHLAHVGAPSEPPPSRAMLQIVNPSPLEAGLSLFTDPRGRDVVSVAVKGTFRMPLPGEQPALADEQIPVRHADGPPSDVDGLCAYPADLVLGKVATDVGLDGSAYTPGGRPVASATTSVSVGNLTKTAWIGSETPWVRTPLRSFLFAAPFDKRRRQYAGTYDADWRQQHFPLLPSDFDLRFFNAAAPELVADGFLQGGERVTLVNVSPRGREEFSLPALHVWLQFREVNDAVTQKADLWNIVFEPDRSCFSLTWGCTHALGKQPSRLREIEIRTSGDTASVQRTSPAVLQQPT